MLRPDKQSRAQTARHAATVLISLCALGGAAHAQTADSSAGPPRRSTAQDLELFSQVLNQIRVNHPDSLDMHRMFIAAIEGMVRAVDPHSFVIQAVRLDSAKLRAFEDGKLWPVPVSFRFIEGAPIVVSVSPGSHAAGLDILPGDELIAAQGRPISAQSASELDVALAGAKGTEIRLTLQRRRLDGTLVELDRVLLREKPEGTTAVPAAFMLGPETGYVRVTSFMSARAASDLHQSLSKLESSGMQRLILDLRDNGGGRVDQAADIAGEFLPSGTLVYSADGKKEDVKETVRVSRSFWRSEKRYPIVLMANEGTASASEIVAGALQDHDRALIVGRPTFGKSLLMRTFPLTDGSLMVLVIGRVKTPCGRIIQRQYQGVSVRDYYRLAGAERDTAGRPRCKTDGGRVVYGGGGIYPDMVLERASEPLWLSKLREADLLSQWIGGYVTATLPPASIDVLSPSFTLPASALADFRMFATRQGVTIPETADADARLQRALVPIFGKARWGDAGYYRAAALLDPEVSRAAEGFERARAILNPSPSPGR